LPGRLLVIDIGNTQIVLGVYDGEDIVASWRIDTRKKRTEDEFAIIVSQLFTLGGVAMESVSDVAISCVVPAVLPIVTSFAKSAFSCDPLIVGPGVKTGVSINIENPKELGADRIANAAGALASYKPPLILVDFGTAITIDVVSAKSEYLGGAIVPGIRLSLNALYERAAKLPDIEFARPPSVIGKNTVTSMQSGAYYGYVSLVDGIVNRVKESLAPKMPKVIATGGEARLVAPASSTIDVVEERLTLDGLRVIHMKNRVNIRQ